MKPKLTEFDKECMARVKAFQHEQEMERREFRKANKSNIAKLKRILFSIGGDRISPQPNWLIEPILSIGFLINLPVILRAMEGNRCHDNVSELWLTRGPRSKLCAICTGYVLSADDGMWRPHSWALARTNIIETTCVGSKYFGLVLLGKSAEMFAKGETD